MSEAPARSFLNRKFWTTIALIIVGFEVYYPFSPAARQQTAMKVLRDLEDRVRARLAADPATADPDGGVLTVPSLMLIHKNRTITDAQWESIVQVIDEQRHVFERIGEIKLIQLEHEGQKALASLARQAVVGDTRLSPPRRPSESSGPTAGPRNAHLASRGSHRGAMRSRR
jgi:hypothetical protein